MNGYDQRTRQHNIYTRELLKRPQSAVAETRIIKNWVLVQHADEPKPSKTEMVSTAILKDSAAMGLPTFYVPRIFA